MTIDDVVSSERRPFADTSLAYLDKSYPAAPSDPRDGIVACSEIFFTRSASSPTPIIVRIGLLLAVVVRIDRRRRNARVIENLVVESRDGIVVDV